MSLSVQEIEKLNLPDLLSFLASKFPGKVAFSTSLSVEDQVITHHIFSNNLPIRVFTLDTGRLFPKLILYLTLQENAISKILRCFFRNTKQ